MLFPAPRQGNHHRPTGRSPYQLIPQRGHSSQSPSGNPLGKLLQSQSKADLINKGVDGVSKSLNGVQQVLKVMETTAPMIQEYGPMVKNLPAMYKMMKAFKDMESEDKVTEDDKNEGVKKQPHTKEYTEQKAGSYSNNARKSAPRDSQPKLFI